MHPAPHDLVARFAAVVGAANVLEGEAAALAHGVDWRRRYFGKPLAVARPRTTAEVAALVRICAETRTPIVPQGGNTGLVGGGTPDASGRQLVISLSRMNKVRAVDVANNTLTVEAGCVLANVQQAARDADRYFPLSLASEGSCEIGGNLSTNAGGTAVLRFGNAREQVLGLEVVLASGEIWDGLRGLRKDNTGYDLKHLFVGAEGTLGIITAAVLKMYPAAAGRATAVVALESPRQAVALLGLLQSRCGERLTGFELFSRICLDLVLKHFPQTTDPLGAPHPHYALIELSDTRDATAVRDLLETALGEALDAGLVRDAALAASEAQSKAMWLLREYVSEAQAHEGKNIKHDVSLPASAIADFIERTDAAVVRAFPGARLVTFGHLGDGNLHYNVSAPAGVDADAWMDNLDAVNLIVHDSVASFNGSISAEHGLGQLKRDEIRRYKSPIELELMRKVKAALDPLGLMNPGKVL
jgi:D-lactate dehydrogenase (cytochrome)